MYTSQLKAIKLCEFPMKIHFRCVGTVNGISVWWHCKWHKWRIVFCAAVLPKHQRNVTRAVRVSSLNLLWEDLTKARISLPLRLRCHPEEKWECRKSLWQLCVLKREAACSRHRFIGSPSSRCREKGSETAWFKCWCVCLKRCKRVRSRVDEWRDVHRGSPKFTKEPQSNLCPESEPRGIQLILWLWKVEALLHSLRMSTWTYKLTCINVSFMYNELHCVRPQGRTLGRKLGFPLGEWQGHISRGHKCPE